MGKTKEFDLIPQILRTLTLLLMWLKQKK